MSQLKYTDKIKSLGPQPTLIITTPAKLLQHGAGATKLKVGDTITIPKSSLIPDTVAQSNSVGVLPHTEVSGLD